MSTQAERCHSQVVHAPVDIHEAELLSRLTECMEELSNVAIAAATGVSSESVRRYRNGSIPTVSFLIKLAELTGSSLLWLMMGEGPRMRKDVPNWFLSQCCISELSSELGRRLDRLDEQIEFAIAKAGLVNEVTHPQPEVVVRCKSTRMESVPDRGGSQQRSHAPV